LTDRAILCILLGRNYSLGTPISRLARSKELNSANSGKYAPRQDSLKQIDPHSAHSFDEF